MSYQIEYQERSGYLYVHVRGERTIEAVITLTGEVVAKAAELHQERVLVDVRDFAGWLKTLESYDVVTGEFDRLRGRGVQRVAILDREFPDPRQPSFFETLAHNRGFALIVRFAPEPAIAWLIEGRDDAQAGK